MRAPPESLMSSTCIVDGNGEGVVGNAPIGWVSKAEQEARLERNLAPSYAAWRQLHMRKSDDYEKFCASKIDKNAQEVAKLRNRFLEGEARKIAESQNKVKQEQTGRIASTQSTAAKMDGVYGQQQTPSANTLSHFDQTNSPRATATANRAQERKRKIPTEETHQWPEQTTAVMHHGGRMFGYSAQPQSVYMTATSSQQPVMPCIGAPDISEDNLRHLMPTSGGNFGAVPLDDIDRVLSEAEQQDDRLPPGASASQLQHASALHQQSQQLHLYQQPPSRSLSGVEYSSQQQYSMPSSSLQRRPEAHGGYAGTQPPMMVQQLFGAVDSVGYMPLGYPGYGGAAHAPAATVRWTPQDLQPMSLPSNQFVSGPMGASVPIHPYTFCYPQRPQ